MLRLANDEIQHQQSMEEVTAASLPEVTNEALPDAMDDDWITNFLAWCRRVSNREMQGLRGRLLAGEANVPGTCSKGPTISSQCGALPPRPPPAYRRIVRPRRNSA